MTNVHHLHRRVVANRRLLEQVVQLPQACGALGFVEAGRHVRPMVLLSLPQWLDVETLGDGLDLAIETLGSLEGFLLVLTLRFSARRWHLLVDPARSASHAVLQALLFADEYYVLVIGRDHASAYRVAGEAPELAAVRPFWVLASRASLPASEQAALRGAFERQLPPGEALLECVADDDVGLLTLTGQDRMELTLAR